MCSDWVSSSTRLHRFPSGRRRRQESRRPRARDFRCHCSGWRTIFLGGGGGELPPPLTGPLGLAADLGGSMLGAAARSHCDRRLRRRSVRSAPPPLSLPSPISPSPPFREITRGKRAHLACSSEFIAAASRDMTARLQVRSFRSCGISETSR